MSHLRIGLVMRRSLRVTANLFLPLLAIAVVGHAPQILAALAPTVQATLKLQAAIEFQLLDAVLAQLVSAAVAYAAILELRGAQVSIFQILRVLGTRMFPIVIVGLVSQMTVLLMNLQPLFGLVALFIITVLYVSIPVVVMEQPGVVDSLRRSAQLTYGRRWNILGLLGFFVLITIAVDLLLNAYFGEQGEIPDAGYLTALSLYRACLAVFASVVAAVTYDELRRSSGRPDPRGL